MAMAARRCKPLLSIRQGLMPLERSAICTNGSLALDAVNKNSLRLRGFCGIRHCDFGCPQLKNLGLLSKKPSFCSFQRRGLKAAPKQMEVILTADLNKVGKAGDIVKVAKGYARNMLIPQLLALPKLDKYVNLVQRQLEAVKLEHPEDETVEEVEVSKTEEQRLKELNTLLNRMETQRVVIRRHTPRRSNSLHKHITPEDVVAEVKRQQKIQIQEINLEMSSYITNLGEFEIPIRLPKTIQIPSGKAKIFLKVKVRRP